MTLRINNTRYLIFFLIFLVSYSAVAQQIELLKPKKMLDNKPLKKDSIRQAIEAKRELIYFNDKKHFVPLGDADSSAFKVRPDKVRKKDSESLAKSSMSSSVSGAGSSSTSLGQLIVYPSPTAASLTMNVDTQVDLYTGKLNTSIPLYTLKSRHIDVPISLNYSTQGNRVNEVSSWVGMGWSLQAGGVISRVMKGLPDEFTGTVMPVAYSFNAYGYLNTKSKVNLTNFSNASNSFKIKIARYANWHTLDGANYGDGFPEAWDLQPDEFYFNFGKHSGKFVFDQDGNINTIPYQNFKIVKTILNNATTNNLPKIVKFEVTTEDGFVYVFGDDSMSSVEESKLETTTLNNFYQYIAKGTFDYDGNGIPDSYVYHRYPFVNVRTIGENLYSDIFSTSGNSGLSTYHFFTSSWYLKEIRTPNNDDNVTFNYSDAGELTYIQDKGTSVSLPNLSEYQVINPQGEPEWVFLSNSAPVTNYGQADYLHPQRGVFTYTVNEITVKSRRLYSIVTSNGNYAGFTATTSRNDLYGDKRLDEISIYSNGFVIKKFGFNYEEIISPPIYQDDDEVYYGDIYNLGSNLYLDTDYHFVNEKFKVIGGNPQAFVNRYNNILSSELYRFHLKEVVEKGTSEQLSLYKFSYNPLILPRRHSTYQDKWGFYNTGNNKGTLIPLIGYTSYFTGGWVSSNTRPLFIWDNALSADYSFKGAIQSPNSVYTQAGVLTGIMNPTRGKVEFTYELNSTSGSVGGLRVSQVKSYPDIDNPAEFINTTYTYTNGNEVGGKQYIYTLPTYNSYESSVSASSSSVIPTYLTKGGIVGYRNVSVSKPGIGRTDYVFKSVPQEGLGGAVVLELDPNSNTQVALSLTEYPFPLRPDRDWRRGLQEEVVTYNQSGQKLNRKSFSYTTRPTNFPITYSKALIGGSFWKGGSQIYRAALFDYESDWVSLDYIQDEQYDQSDPGNEDKKITTITEFKYSKVDPPGQTSIVADLLPRKISKIYPNGEKVSTETKYVNDYLPVAYSTSSDLAAKALYRLREKKMDNTIIETITYVESPSLPKYLMSATLNMFKEYNGLNGALNVYPISVKKFTPSNYSFTSFQWSTVPFSTVVNDVWSGTTFEWDLGLTYKDEVFYNNFDLYGNPLTITGNDGIQRNYTWGFNNSLLTSATENTGTYQHQTSYTHQPLVGVTKITDPNQLSSNFIYDQFERLKLIKDNDNNILNRYRYNFKGQNNSLPEGQLTATGCKMTGESVVFAASISTEYGQTTYEWDFGDGSTITTSSGSKSHTYSSGGIYYVKVKRSNSEYFGETTSTMTVVINNPVTSASVCVNGVVSYDICGVDNPQSSVCFGGGGGVGGELELMAESSTELEQTNLALPLPCSGSVSQPTLRVSVSGPAFSYQWQYKLNNGPWTNFGSSSSSVIGPPGYGGCVAGTYQVRCIVEDACGNDFISIIYSLYAYASTNCSSN